MNPNTNKEIISEEIQIERKIINDQIELNVRIIETVQFERIKRIFSDGSIQFTEWKEKEGTQKIERFELNKQKELE